MNYGRYFRLNQALSKVEDGVAIYDYINLPAYFGPSVDNPMSPKYPISVTVTSDAVCFRLHYSAFKIEKKGLDKVEKLRLNENEKRRFLDSDFPQYAYNEDNINNKTLPKKNNEGLTDVGMAHMEEVILELPYTDNVSSCLSDTIKDIYSSTFPQVIDENVSMGGRFLEQLIRKRYPSKVFSTSENGIERQLYDELRKVMDDTASYSGLWLMDLYKGGRVDLYKKITDENSGKSKEIIIGFLRKLLLDFMFDLKHSDVFQNSASYQKMYSGLMSDFYFSALIHKCEYYYNRDLITLKTDEITKETDEDIFEEEKKRIVGLYANNLYKAEELWTQDIMNPNAEKYFEYNNSKKTPSIDKNKSIKQFLDRVFVNCYMVEDNRFLKRGSWFAEPEEEMRRVCFPMDEITENGKLVKQHICNTNTLVAYLKMKSDKDVPHEIVSFSEKNREIISRWFLRRYDFNDVCHLHLSRWANLLTFSWFFFLILLFIISNTAVEYCIKIIDSYPYLPMWNGLSFLTCIAIVIIILRCQYKKHTVDMLSTHVRQSSQRIFNFTLLLAVIVIGVHWGYFFVVLLTLGIICLFFPKCRRVVEKVFERSTSYLHLFFPRLVASITTAWLTMTMGFDIYVAFFDQHVSRGTAITIWAIVAIFVMYEINRITPRSHIWKKLLRGCQLVIISYGISLVVGTIVINFVGRQYMDRGDGFGGITYSTGFVDTDAKPLKVIAKDVTFGDLNKSQQDKVMHDVHCEKNNCQSITVFRIGEHEVFFMRDFLIMFSCVTMFMGIFLQMFIFDDKKMTEF